LFASRASITVVGNAGPTNEEREIVWGGNIGDDANAGWEVERDNSGGRMKESREENERGVT